MTSMVKFSLGLPVDFHQNPWLLSSTAVPIMGYWGEGGEAHFEPFTQLGGASILDDIVLEVTLLDGSLADISVGLGTSYVFPGDTVTITTPNITA